MFSPDGLAAKSWAQELLDILNNPRYAQKLAILIVGDLAGRESPAVLSA